MLLGWEVGCADGIDVGWQVGAVKGCEVGCLDGCSEGCEVGWDVKKVQLNWYTPFCFV